MENNDPYEELEIYLKQINNEISEVFDKLNVNENDSAIDTVDSSSASGNDSPQQPPPIAIIKAERPSLNHNDGITKQSIHDNSDEWNSLAQFEKLIELEVENLETAAKNNQHKINNNNTTTTTTTVSTTAVKNNILKPEKHVTIPLQSFSNKTKCITNINNCLENRNNDDDGGVHTSKANQTQMIITPGSSDDSILKSIDEDNKSTSSSVSTSSAFEDSTNLYSEKSESSMSSINKINGNINNNINLDAKIIIIENGKHNDDDDALEVLSSYDNDSGNDEFDEKGEGFNNFSYSSSDSRCDKKFSRNYFNSLPLMRAKKQQIHTNFNSIKRRNFNDHASIEQEPFHDDIKVVNLSSPSPSSWSSDSNMIQQQNLSTKSSSVPMLVRRDQNLEDFNKLTVLRNSRSQSDRYLCEIQAADAMKWLREAGFPQYAQMYQDLQFPIDLSCVEKDHPFLEKDQLQALYRRLVILNRSATMRLDGQYSRNASNKRREDSDEDVCALSKNWTFQPEIRRWSRVGEMGPLSLNLPKAEATSKTTSRESTPEEFDLNVPQHVSLVAAAANNNYLSVPPAVNLQSAAIAQDTPQANNTNNNNNLKRSGSERLRDGAKNILRRVESIKSRRKKKKNREGVVISGPVHLDIMQLHEKFQNLSSSKDIKTCRSSTTSPLVTSPVNSSPTPLFLFADPKICPTTDSSAAMFGHHLSPFRKGHPASRTSPLHFFSSSQRKKHHHHHHHSQDQQQQQQQQQQADDSSSLCSEVSLDSSNESAEKKLSPIGRYFHHHHHGSSSNNNSGKKQERRAPIAKTEDLICGGALSDTEAFYVRAQKKKSLSKSSNSSNNSGSLKANTIARGGGGSLNLGRESNRYRENLKSRRIFRSRSAVRHSAECNDNNTQDVTLRDSQKSSSVVRWHSFRAATNTKRDFNDVEGVSLCKLSCGQIEKLRKLALVTLTGYMERYCPTHRTGWNWELPKFIKKIKTPDYKDKKVFGVPFSVVLQKTGHTLPKGIQAALTWLKINALDQVGIFRKSGVKSRIAKLKTAIDQTDENIIKIFEDQQAYDVADVVKQYFRDLPESLLTTKLCDTFVSIFQYLPVEVKYEALQSAILLLPDENREVLLMLLEFLNQVAAKSEYNQMSPNNLAVCLAPSIFQNGVHSNTPTASPRRKRATGVPDAKDLDANKASTQCLTYLIVNFKKVFFVSCEKINRCNFSYMEESRPVTLEALGDAVQLSNWRSYLYECIKATVKEGREKSRGWISLNSYDSHIEVFYRKVGDGHPLKLWKCVTEIDADPITIMNRITKERHLWDKQLLKMRVIEQLDTNSDVFQYACSSGHIVTDFCVLRTSCTDLPRGACATVEISIEHPGAPLLLSGVRGVVLASRYLIEPIGSGKSRVMHLARVDTKGRTIEWYKNFGYICALNLARIRDGLKSKNLD